jgi:large subunit ribosomal protein L19
MNNIISNNQKLNCDSLIRHVELKHKKLALPTIHVGDTVRLGVQIKEGEKTRTQAFEGVVISMRRSGINKTITLRRVLQGVGVERCFLLHSPKVSNIEILRSSKVRRSKLYYLRSLSGKATRLKQRFR